MKKSRLARLLEYIYIPVIFCIIGYVILWVGLQPVWEQAAGVFRMFSAEQAPSFDSSLSSIYDPDAKTDQSIEIHTEVIPDASASDETYRVLHFNAMDEEDVLSEDQMITGRYLRFEEEVSDDGQQAAQIYTRNTEEDNDGSEEPFARMTVEDGVAYLYTEEDDTDPIHIDLADLLPDTNLTEEQTADLDLEGVLEVLREQNTAYVMEDAEGQKVAYYTGSGASLEDMITSFRRVQLVYADTAGSKVHEYISANDFAFPDSGQQYASLSCDRIGLKTPVYWDDSNEILRYGAGQYMGSLPPGYGSLIVLSGHNNTFFTPLQDIQKNDIIHFDTNYCAYEYVVTDVQVMNENELKDYILENIFDEEHEQLLMYTCYPFHATIGRKTDRLVVFGERTSGYDVKWRGLDE